MGRIGFTTSIPVEVIFAAGETPVDLNNIFVSSDQSSRFVESAESCGFPRNTCAWIKGIYSSLAANEDIKTVISVVEGDCSNTRALTEVLESEGIECIKFSYPSSRDYGHLKKEIDRLCSHFGVSFASCVAVKRELDVVRQKLSYLDELTWKQSKVTGFENHIWQVSGSDFNGDYCRFDTELAKFLEIADGRPPAKWVGKASADARSDSVRLGYTGVPPIIPTIYDFLETLGARVVFNEVQRQFTMADGIGIDDLAEVYRIYTYPYFLNARIPDITTNIKKRGIEGVIHYVQSFCFRGIEDIVMRNAIDVPVLTLEGDRPGELDSRTKLRIEAFVDMLKQRRNGNNGNSEVTV